MLHRVPRKVLVLYRKIILHCSDDSVALGHGFQFAHDEARRILEPLCAESTPQNLDRAIDEAERVFKKSDFFEQTDPFLFKNHMQSAYFSYFDSPIEPLHNMSVETPEYSRTYRFHRRTCQIINIPKLPIRDIEKWKKKWKENIPEIPL
ncbi:hypothetical protein RF11_15039 [Thelohanellus kitauei]|uniref:Uncharacterized protein n=1 Tax=Thelohanellus kitauei TaxID=669202 RepID=A0A0C2MHI8_THEKT|nr:hypothetical protein RF11_15039 [Thelohanellus kitauei]